MNIKYQHNFPPAFQQKQNSPELCVNVMVNTIVMGSQRVHRNDPEYAETDISWISSPFFPSFPLPFLSLPEQPGVRHPWLQAVRSRQEGPLGWDMVSGCTDVLEVRLGQIQTSFPVPMSSPGGPPLWWLWLFKKRELVGKEPENEMVQCSGCI